MGSQGLYLVELHGSPIGLEVEGHHLAPSRPQRLSLEYYETKVCGHEGERKESATHMRSKVARVDPGGRRKDATENVSEGDEN